MPNFFGYQGTLTREVLPPGVDPSKLVGIDSSNSNKGKGEIKRNEQISLRVAAVITDVLPNGNFVISGKQEVRVNYELRDLRIAGLVRPEDISPSNTISYDKISYSLSKSRSWTDTASPSSSCRLTTRRPWLLVSLSSPRFKGGMLLP